MSTSQDAAAYCADLVRRADRDRYLATLFCPAAARPALFALHAFNAEVARIRDLVSAPLPGEVRLQWWRDVLSSEGRGEASANPVAAALMVAIARYELPGKAFVDLLDARVFDLYDDPMPSLADLEGYCGETSSALFRLASLILADGGDAGTADAAGHAGVAYAMTGLLRSLPIALSRGQIYVPRDILAEQGLEPGDLLDGTKAEPIARALTRMRAEARRHLGAALGHRGGLPRAVVSAFLPLALVEPTLKALERPGHDALHQIADIPQWRRQWLLWRQARKLG